MKNNKNLFLPLILTFIFLNAIIYVFGAKWNRWNIDVDMLMIGNLVVAILSLFSLWLHRNAIKAANPNAFVRTVMVATGMKMLILGGAVLVYITTTNDPKAKYVVIAGVVLYFIYTFIETRSATSLNRKKHEQS